MEDYLKKHQDLVLASAALLMLIGIVIFFIWGIGVVAYDWSQAVISPTANTDVTTANIETAKKILSDRGLLNTVIPPAASASSSASSSAIISATSTN